MLTLSHHYHNKMSFIKNIKTNTFIKSVSVLMTGTVLAQALTYLITPVLTRIYSTEEMGELGVYLRIVGFVAALATMRYELTLPLPKRDKHAFLLYRLSLKIAFFIILACTLTAILYLVTKSFELYESLFLLFCFLSVIFVVFINTGTNWAIRVKNFKRISNSRISNSLFSNAFRWIFGVMSFGSLGLIAATLIGYVVSSFSFIKEFFKINANKKKQISNKQTYVLAKEYKDFPLINLPHVLVDLGRDLLVAGLIILFFSKSVFGSYSHSYAILRIPLVIVGASIGQVLFSTCSEYLNKGKEIQSILKKTLITLVGLSFIPFLFIFLYGEDLFAFVFSAEWAESGYYSEIMSIWLFGNFLASSISTIPLIIGRQKEFFFLGLISSAIQIIGFGVLPLYIGNNNDAFIDILWIVSIIMTVFNVLVVFITLYYSKIQKIKF